METTRDKRQMQTDIDRSRYIRALRAAARQRAYRVAMRSSEDLVSAYIEALRDQGFIINNKAGTVDFIGDI